MHDSFDNGTDMSPAFAGYPNSVDEIDRMMHDLASARQHMIAEGTQKPMDAKDEQLVNLAHKAGEMTAMYRAERQRRERAIAKIDELQPIADMAPVWERRAEGWQKRAEAAELKLKRRSARKR